MQVERDHTDLIKIGVFDSGLGGLTVLKQLRKELPRGVQFLYLGDTARVPYGSKTPETVTRYTLEAVDFLTEQGARIIVLACNSASAIALDTVRSQRPQIAIYGVITAASQEAVAAHTSGILGVLCTKATFQSGAYQRALNSLKPDVATVTVACPLFVPLVEDGWAGTEIVRQVAERYLARFPETPSTLILGCTHYPLLQDDLAALLPNTRIVDSAIPTARMVAADLLASPNGGLLSSRTTSRVHYWATDVGEQFIHLAEAFLEDSIPVLVPVRLDR